MEADYKKTRRIGRKQCLAELSVVLSLDHSKEITSLPPEFSFRSIQRDCIKAAISFHYNGLVYIQ